MPHNFLYVGLIMEAFPEAKIVHAKRDPKATCWSNFKISFLYHDLAYSSTLQDTVKYFRTYADLTNFWHSITGNRIYVVRYKKSLMIKKMKQKCWLIT